MKNLNKVLFFLFLSTMIYFDSSIQVMSMTASMSSTTQTQNQMQSEVLNFMKNLIGSSSLKKKRNTKRAKLSELARKADEETKKEKASETAANTETQVSASASTEASGSTDNKQERTLEIIDKSKIITEAEKLAVSLENWLQVSSPEFRNSEKFPAITLPDYSVKNMQINDSNFRINESFDASKTGSDYPPSELYFYFRISDKNIYYTESKTSLVILGNITLKRVVGVTPENKPNSTCFEIGDQDNNQWKLCAEDKIIRQKWICYIEKLLGVENEDCKDPESVSDSNVIVQDEQVTDPVILIPLPSKTCNDSWNYKTKGNDWECDCSEGKTQSPIDIQSNSVVRSPVKPVFKYREIEYNESTAEANPIKFEYKDNSIKIVYEQGFGKVVTLDGNVYSAQEVIFHTPSQHRIDGKDYPMEMEIVHVGESSGSVAQNLVLSILFEAKAGVYNKFLDEIDLFNLPNPMYAKRTIKNNINLNSILYSIDSNEFPIWKPFSMYTYEGSLTAPPCTEKTIYYVKSKPIQLGNTTLQLFREAIKVPDLMDEQGNVIINSAEPTNNREVQPLNGRKVYLFNYVEESVFNSDDTPRKTQSGHYEKVTQKMTNYYHVSSNKPSGLPGSFVVSEKEAQGYE